MSDNLITIDREILALGPASYVTFRDGDLSNKVPGAPDAVNHGLTLIGTGAYKCDWVVPYATTPHDTPSFTGDPTKYLSIPQRLLHGAASFVQIFFGLAQHAQMSYSSTSTLRETAVSEHSSGGAGVSLEMSGYKQPQGTHQPQIVAVDDSGVVTTQVQGVGVGHQRRWQMWAYMHTPTSTQIAIDSGLAFSGGARPYGTIAANPSSVEQQIGRSSLSGGQYAWTGTLFQVATYLNVAPFLNADGTWNLGLLRHLYEVWMPNPDVAHPLGPVPSWVRSWPRKSIWNHRLPSLVEGGWTPEPSVSAAAVSATLQQIIRGVPRATGPDHGTAKMPIQALGGLGGARVFAIDEVATPPALWNYERVHPAGGQWGSFKKDKPGAYEVLQNVPIPVDFFSDGYVPGPDRTGHQFDGMGGEQQLEGNDLATAIYFRRAPDVNGHRKISLIEMWKTVRGVGFSTPGRGALTATVNDHGTGNVPAGSGNASYGIVFIGPDNTIGWDWPATTAVKSGVTQPGAVSTLSGGDQSVTITQRRTDPTEYPGLLGIAVIESRDDGNTYDIVQRFYFGTDVPNPTPPVDTASAFVQVTLSNYTPEGLAIPYQNGFMPESGLGGPVSCGTFGYCDDITASNGYPNPTGPAGEDRSDWAITASGIFHTGGMILLNELLTGKIDHVIECAISLGSNTTWVWPATSTDTAIYPFQQGMRLAFPPGTFATWIAAYPTAPSGKPWAPMVLAVGKALETHGLLLKDSTTNGIGIITENSPVRGRARWPVILNAGGFIPAFGTTAQSSGDGLSNLPWELLQVAPISTWQDHTLHPELWAAPSEPLVPLGLT